MFKSTSELTTKNNSDSLCSLSTHEREFVDNNDSRTVDLGCGAEMFECKYYIYFRLKNELNKYELR